VTDLRVVVEADGGSRGNPGPAGYGSVVREAATGEILLERYGSLGTTTNNVAEYTGLIEGLRAAAELAATHVAVRMDSKLVVEQMSGRWQIKNPGLRPLAAEAAQLAARFAEVTYEWIPRERNRAADALANRAMDEAAGKVVPDVPAQETVPVEPASEKPKQSWAPPASTADATRLILVRHGETALTRQGRYSGRCPMRGRRRRWPPAAGSRASPGTSPPWSPRRCSAACGPPRSSRPSWAART